MSFCVLTITGQRKGQSESGYVIEVIKWVDVSMNQGCGSSRGLYSTFTRPRNVADMSVLRGPMWRRMVGWGEGRGVQEGRLGEVCLLSLCGHGHWRRRLIWRR